MNATSISSKLLVTGLILVGLYFGKDLLIPFVIAVVIWYLLNSLNKLFSGIRIGKRKLPLFAQISLSGLVLVAVFFFLNRLVVANFKEFVLEYPNYHANFIEMTSGITTRFELPISLDEVLSNSHLPEILSDALDLSFVFVSTTFLILLYVIFLLFEQQLFSKKLKLIYKDRKEYHQFLKMLRKVDSSTHTYVSIKTSLCLLAGILSYIVMLILAVDFAVLWAFLIFLFGYIPVIGALLAVLLPTLIAIVQYGNYFEPVLLISLLGSIQLIVGNIIEPRVLGTKLNLSPLVVMLALTFWGSMWGIAGMFLCVPITVIMMIIFNQFKGTRNIAILLSGGKILQ